MIVRPLSFGKQNLGTGERFSLIFPDEPGSPIKNVGDKRRGQASNPPGKMFLAHLAMKHRHDFMVIAGTDEE